MLKKLNLFVSQFTWTACVYLAKGAEFIAEKIPDKYGKAKKVCYRVMIECDKEAAIAEKEIDQYTK